MPTPATILTSSRPPAAPARLDGMALWIFRAEAGLTIFCFLMLSNALVGPLFNPTQGEEAGFLRLLWLPVYGIALLLSLLRWDKFLNILPAVFMIGGLILFCFASKFWSIEPGVTTRRTIALFFTCVFGLYLGARWRGPHLTELLGISFAILAVGALIACVATPGFGIHQDVNAGLWRGLWYEKNQMAAMMTLGFIACTTTAYQVPERRRLWIGFAVLMFFLVLMTRSKTSLLACMLVAGAFPVFFALKKGGVLSILFVWLAATVSLVGMALYVMAPELIFKALGKDPTLTGRTEIWESLGRLSDKRPLLGYGYKAFWTKDSVPAAVVRQETSWEVPSAHNGWLDLLIQLGWVGVILFGACLVACFFCALFRYDRVKDGFFSVLMLMLFSFLILSESFILSQNSLVWALFVCAMARLTANALESER
ncbi:O-antigen ligase [Asticcacaulis sp. AC402]|uniref:O-antigen ligase family protein n=1 Tax=Asticcacaulis sp. AC402 TaxID=1282361 RepID=UPI0003FDBD8F|nr:O-antigen ligase [Asticcacaulis sp. AC402]